MTDNRTTERLRALLDERGVEWSDRANAWTYETHWKGADGKPVCASQRSDGIGDLVLKQHVIPEQAIAATLGRGTCKPTEGDCCPICGEDLVKCNVGIGELGGAVELDPPIYHNYCPNCGAKVVEQ